MSNAINENDKRILIAIIIVFILIFVIAGYIGLIVEKIMKKQAQGADKMLNNVIRANVISSPREFKKFAIKKNRRQFIKQSMMAVLILLLGLAVYIINSLISKNWMLDLMDYKKEGFGTILFLWDFAKAPHVNFFGMSIISDWPPILNTPHPEATAWASYIIFPCLLVGTTWFLIATQAHIARTFRIKTIIKNIYYPNIEEKEETTENISINNTPKNS